MGELRNGWAKIYDYNTVRVIDNKVAWAIDGHPSVGKKIYPYRWNKKLNGWVECSSDVTVETMRKGMSDGRYVFR